MSETKKVWLVLMEGPNDERATYSHIESLVEKSFSFLKTQPKTIFYDITNQTDKRTFINTQNIKLYINAKVNEALAEYHISKSDLNGIILIIDVDGVFLDDDLFIEDPSIKHITYGKKSVICKNKDAILGRNERKRNNIRFLLDYVPYLMGVPFRVYFYSCNSEHVIFNEINCSEDRKEELSRISMKYDDEDFWEKICSEEVILSTSYVDSWNALINIDDKIVRSTNLNTLYLEIKSIAEDNKREEKDANGENKDQHKRYSE